MKINTFISVNKGCKDEDPRETGAKPQQVGSAHSKRNIFVFMVMRTSGL